MEAQNHLPRSLVYKYLHGSMVANRPQYTGVDKCFDGSWMKNRSSMLIMRMITHPMPSTTCFQPLGLADNYHLHQQRGLSRY